MDYREALKNLREQVFAEPEKVEKPKSGFIPPRTSVSPVTTQLAVQKSVDWLRQIKAASEEVQMKNRKVHEDTQVAVSDVAPASFQKKPPTVLDDMPEANKEAYIKRRGGRPSGYTPDIIAMGPHVAFNDDWENVAQAVKDIESGGGNYAARGPVVESGAYKGQRAMGAYQVMPGNLASWSKAALGRVVSEDEFMNDPAIQDAIFIDRMKKVKEEHGTIEDAVSVWFSGQPVAKAGNASDGYTTTPEYINRFQKNYNRYKSSQR